jgi:hypothetical protein
MTSEIRVDNLKGSTTSGSINVLGEGTSATTNLQQGLAKVWFNIDCTGTPSYRDSLNCTSLTDDATGNMTHNFTNNMGNANYSLSGASGGDAGAWANNLAHFSTATPDTTSTSKIAIAYNGSYADTDRNSGSYHGDLA